MKGRSGDVADLLNAVSQRPVIDRRRQKHKVRLLWRPLREQEDLAGKFEACACGEAVPLAALVSKMAQLCCRREMRTPIS